MGSLRTEIIQHLKDEVKDPKLQAKDVQCPEKVREEQKIPVRQ